VQTQQLLLPDLAAEADMELVAVEHEALTSCKKLKELSATQVRFVVVYLLADPQKTSMAELAEKAGTSRRQAYRWLNDTTVQMAMGEVAQRVCGIGFVRLANSIGMLAEKLAADLLSGRKTKLESWEQWLATVALRRAGLDAGNHRTMGMKINPKGGGSVEAFVSEGFVPDPDGEAAAAAFVERLRSEQLERIGGTLRPGWEQGTGHDAPGGGETAPEGADEGGSEGVYTPGCEERGEGDA